MHIYIGPIIVQRQHLAALLEKESMDQALDSLTLMQYITDALYLSSHQDNLKKLWTQVRGNLQEPEPLTDQDTAPLIPAIHPSPAPETQGDSELPAIIGKLRDSCETQEQRQFLDNALHFTQYDGRYSLAIGDRIFKEINYSSDQINWMTCINNEIEGGDYHLPTSEKVIDTLSNKTQASQIKPPAQQQLDFLEKEINSTDVARSQQGQQALKWLFAALPDNQADLCAERILKYYQKHGKSAVMAEDPEVMLKLINYTTSHNKPEMFGIFMAGLSSYIHPYMQATTGKTGHRIVQLRGVDPHIQPKIAEQMFKGAQMYHALSNDNTQSAEKRVGYRACCITLALLASCSDEHKDSALSSAQHRESSTTKLADEAWQLYKDTKEDTELQTHLASNAHWRTLTEVLEFNPETTLARAQHANKPSTQATSDASSIPDTDSTNTPPKFSVHSLPIGYQHLSDTEQEKLGLTPQERQRIQQNKAPLQEENSYAATSLYYAAAYQSITVLKREESYGTQKQFNTFESLELEQKQAFYLLRNAYMLSLELNKKTHNPLDGLDGLDKQSCQQHNALLKTHSYSDNFPQNILDWAKDKGFTEYDLTGDYPQAIGLFLEGFGSPRRSTE